jgi:hypothetical protein
MLVVKGLRSEGEAVSSDSESKLQKDIVATGESSNKSEVQNKTLSKSPNPSNSSSVHPFIEQQTEVVAYVNKDSIPTNWVIISTLMNTSPFSIHFTKYYK